MYVNFLLQLNVLCDDYMGKKGVTLWEWAEYEIKDIHRFQISDIIRLFLQGIRSWQQLLSEGAGNREGRGLGIGNVP